MKLPIAVLLAAAAPCQHLVDHRATHPIALQGQLVVTHVNADDEHELGVLPLGAAKARLLTHDKLNQSEVEIAPDGRSFLYTVRRKLDDFGNLSEIWRMNLDGTGAHKLAGGQRMGVPAWHPDGRRAVFCQWGKDEDSRLYWLDVNTRKVTPFPTQLRGPADPEISYDGKALVFKMPVKGDRDFQPSIYVMNLDGSGVRRLTRGYSDHDPVFSRDNRKVYFERYYGPGDWFDASQDRGTPAHNLWGIVEIDLKTGRERVIVPHDPCGRHFYWLPTVSPDGRSLMYVHIDVKAETWTDLWVCDLDGQHAQRVPGSAGCYFFDWASPAAPATAPGPSSGPGR